MAVNEEEENDDDSWAELDRHMEEYKEFVDRLFGDYRQFIQALVADVRLASEHVKEVDDQYRRRTYLRAFFSFVEGALFARRTMISSFLNKNPECIAAPRLSDGERALLNEIEYELDRNGNVKVRSRNFQPFIKYFRFTFSVYFKYFGKPNPLEYAGIGWQSFQKVYQARNRISHPKAVGDLTVSDEELENLGVAFDWFVDQFKKR